MSRDYNTSSKASRTVFAVLASLSTVLILSGITVLADHYHEAGPVLAAIATTARG